MLAVGVAHPLLSELGIEISSANPWLDVDVLPVGKKE
tara:strand:- start:1 stop:111 length:111 start_codon:yes stop_codon:yes gene_type:complete